MQRDFDDLGVFSHPEPTPAAPFLGTSAGKKGAKARALAPKKTTATKKSVARTGGKIVYPRRKAGENPLNERTPVIITLELLQEHFGTPLHVAAAKLGICATALKRVCRKVGIPKWPFRETRVGAHTHDSGSSSDHTVETPATCSSSDTENMSVEEPCPHHTPINTRAAARATACAPQDTPAKGRDHVEIATAPFKPQRRLSVAEAWRPEITTIYPFESLPATQARRASLTYEEPLRWDTSNDIDILSTEEETIDSDHDSPWNFMAQVNGGIGNQGHSLDFLDEAMEAASQDAWAILPVC